MSFLSMPFAWVVGAAETTVRYVASQMPIISSKPVHGGQEAVYLLKQPWQWLTDNCKSIEVCKRASERSFVPMYTATSNFCGKYSLIVTDFLANNLAGIPVAGAIAKEVNSIAKWAVKDYYQEGTSLQTVFSVAIVSYSTVKACTNLYKCYKHLNPDIKVVRRGKQVIVLQRGEKAAPDDEVQRPYIRAIGRLALCGMFVCVVWSEVQALRMRAT